MKRITILICVMLCALFCSSCQISIEIHKADPYPQDTQIATTPDPEINQDTKIAVTVVNVTTQDYYTGDYLDQRDFTELSVELSDGALLTYRFDGKFISTVYPSKFSEQSSNDFLVYLDHHGSSQYGMGEVHVISLKDNALVEIPLTINNSLNLDIPCGETLNNEVESCLFDAYPMNVDGIDILRAVYARTNNYEDERVYIEVAYEGDHWEVMNSDTTDSDRILNEARQQNSYVRRGISILRRPAKSVDDIIS